MIICVSEDRAAAETSVKILLLSLAEHCGDVPVALAYRAADQAFREWLKACPQVNLVDASCGNSAGWNVKAQALLALLEAGHSDVVWLDSDIVVTEDFRRHFGSLDDRTMVLTEEALFGTYADPDAMRARMWGFAVGRRFPFVANSAVIRVTPFHIPLLRAWNEWLGHASYQAAQRRPWSERPAHMFGDQDVLTALLTSTDYASVPIKFMMRGADIIQYFGLSGYTCAERWSHLLGRRPAFIHSQVFKPWIKFKHPRRPENLRDLVDTLYLDLSPYTLVASRYAARLPREQWMDAHSRLASLLRAIGFWHPPLVGAPIAALADFVRTTDLKLLKRIYFRMVSLRDPEPPHSRVATDRDGVG